MIPAKLPTAAYWSYLAGLKQGHAHKWLCRARYRKAMGMDYQSQVNWARDDHHAFLKYMRYAVEAA